MNFWTEQSVEFANQRNYLDELYKVYPISPNIRRELKQDKLENIKNAFVLRDNKELVLQLLDLDLFPIKDSFVAYLRKDKGAIERNPQTINRIAGTLFQMGFDEIIEKCTQPKETNRQMGPMFKRWIDSGVLGVPVIKEENEFLKYEGNCIYNASDANMKNFAMQYFGYLRDKGIDFIAKFNNKFVIAEAKFLTDFGGHQNAQFEDAVSTMQIDFSGKMLKNEVVPISIMDGVLYIKGSHKFYKYLEKNSDKIIISSLLLREFLFSL